MDLSISRLPEPKKVVFEVMSVGCLSVCLSVCMSVYRPRDYTDCPIYMKFGMEVQLTNTPRRFFHFFEILNFKGHYPPKTPKIREKSKFLKNGSNDFD